MQEIAEAQKTVIEQYRENLRKIWEAQEYLNAHKEKPKNKDFKPLKDDYAGVLRVGDKLFCVSELPNQATAEVFRHPDNIKIATDGKIMNPSTYVKQTMQKETWNMICSLNKVRGPDKKAFDEYIKSDTLTIDDCTQCIVIDGIIYVPTRTYN